MIKGTAISVSTEIPNKPPVHHLVVCVLFCTLLEQITKYIYKYKTQIIYIATKYNTPTQIFSTNCCVCTLHSRRRSFEFGLNCRVELLWAAQSDTNLRFTSKSSLCLSSQRACALRALGLLLADGAPTVGMGKTF